MASFYNLWFTLALVLFVGAVGLLADLATYRAYPEMKDHDWGWLVKLYRGARRAYNEWRYRRTQRRPRHV